MAVIVAGLAGVAVGACIALLLRTVLASRRTDSVAATQRPNSRRRDRIPAETMLQLLPTAAVFLDGDDVVRLANSAALELGLVRGTGLGVPELSTLVHAARRTAVPQTAELRLDIDSFPRRTVLVGARAQRLDGSEVALIVDDLTEAKRVESVRRDFVANVGHEIKTPVGALQVLAEAALDAHDDPDAVQRFVGRMQQEAQRLSRLVKELLDLSRLQGGEPLPTPTDVSVDAILDEATDRARPAAEGCGITIVRSGVAGLIVRGDERQLVTAVANLLGNSIAYSPEKTKVAVSVQLNDDVVEIAVTDQGIGIPKAEQERIFERFYRVDPARSRATGGTGLGLAIVKHTVVNHRGDVSVWSRPGSGSTFTIRLPAYGRRASPGAPALQEMTAP